jgi:hypothetical protein
MIENRQVLASEISGEIVPPDSRTIHLPTVMRQLLVISGRPYEPRIPWVMSWI